jgi:hypothetical protein
MLPLLRDGDEVVVRRGGFLWPGQVLVFADAHRQVWVHRLLGYRPSGGGWRLVLKGDNAATIDPPLDPGRVLGRVVAVRREGEQTPLGALDNFLRWLRSLQEYVRER